MINKKSYIAPPDNCIPISILDALNWNPSYHHRRAAIIYNFNKTTEHYLICGKLLCDADREKDWKHDGSMAHNFFQWAEKELGFKRSNIQRIMANWIAVKDMIPNHSDLIIEIDFSKLAMIAPLFKDATEEQKLEYLHMAKVNTVRDLESNIKSITGNGIPHDECLHPEDKQETWFRCNDCGKFYKL